MRRKLPRGIAAILLTLPALALQAACGSGGSGSTVPPPPPPQAITVQVQPSTANVRAGEQQQFTATVTGSANTAVTWSINGIAGGDDTVGRIDANGLYTGPAVMPNPNGATVRATSVANSTASGTSALSILNPVPIVSGASPSVLGASAQAGASTTTLLTVTGSKFASGARIVFAGQAVNTTVVSPTQLSAAVTITAAQAQAGSVTVRVNNPAPGSVDSTTSASVSIRTTTVVSPTAAVRFLEQSTFGPTIDSITQLQYVGFEQFLQDQFNAPASTFPDPLPTDNNNDPTTLQRRFFTNALYMPDQLRQRVAYALHKIWVVSWVVVDRWDAFAGYLRMHQGHAFGTYRQVMENVTLNPAMGKYQDIANNDKANPAAGISCNENYGRELMQLFTIGIWQRNQDGTLKLDAQNNPMPTYYQAVVENNACALTGWTYQNLPGQNRTWPRPENYAGSLVAVESHHDTTAKTLLNNFPLPANQTAYQDLTGTLDNIYTYPSTAPHVSTLLIQQFVTSNPSPAYVKRVADVFDSGTFTSNGFTFGNGQRGDLRALIAAILLDPEARRGDDPAQTFVSDGKLREPILWVTGIFRMLGATSDGGRVINDTRNMGQFYLFPPTVFSYFSPDFSVNTTGGPVPAPEVQLHTTATSLTRANFVNTIVYSANLGPTSIDYTPWAARLTQVGQSQFLDELNLVLLHGKMSAPMRTSIINAMNAVPAGATQDMNKTKAALYLIFSSSQYQVQR